MMESMKRLKEVRGEHTVHPLVAEFVTDASLNVLKTFGYEAPDVLNNYCCELEDVVLSQGKTIDKLRAEIKELKRMSKEEVEDKVVKEFIQEYSS